jgi:ribose/xylose/arabinose/galactoside ABC-type transport system permease subunit
MNELGKFLVALGLLIALVGAALWSGIGKGWIGHLPGDLHYSKGSFSFYFPLATCLLLSLLLTVLLWILRR